MKYVLIWCASGKLRVRADDTVFQLLANEVITITSGQVHCIQENHNGVGWVLEFTLDFFCKDDTDIELVFHNGLFCHFAENEVIALQDDMTVARLLIQIKEELEENPYQSSIAIHAYIKLLLVAINRCKVNRGDGIYKPDALFLKFLEMVRNEFNHSNPVSYYATGLQTTEAKLNELSKLHAGKTAQNVIYGLIASEAKRLFLYENLSVKEAAFTLGFNDPFYFSNFFKKHTGLSPKSFKTQFSL